MVDANCISRILNGDSGGKFAGNILNALCFDVSQCNDQQYKNNRQEVINIYKEIRNKGKVLESMNRNSTAIVVESMIVDDLILILNESGKAASNVLNVLCDSSYFPDREKAATIFGRLTNKVKILKGVKFTTFQVIVQRKGYSEIAKVICEISEPDDLCDQILWREYFNEKFKNDQARANFRQGTALEDEARAAENVFRELYENDNVLWAVNILVEMNDKRVIAKMFERIAHNDNIINAIVNAAQKDLELWDKFMKILGVNCIFSTIVLEVLLCANVEVAAGKILTEMPEKDVAAGALSNVKIKKDVRRGEMRYTKILKTIRLMDPAQKASVLNTHRMDMGVVAYIFVNLCNYMRHNRCNDHRFNGENDEGRFDEKDEEIASNIFNKITLKADVLRSIINNNKNYDHPIEVLILRTPSEQIVLTIMTILDENTDIREIIFSKLLVGGRNQRKNEIVSGIFDGIQEKAQAIAEMNGQSIKSIAMLIPASSMALVLAGNDDAAGKFSNELCKQGQIGEVVVVLAQMSDGDATHFLDLIGDTHIAKIVMRMNFEAVARILNAKFKTAKKIIEALHRSRVAGKRNLHNV
ncbi:MAG: hypothetical protein LBI69_02580 [Puniceicoccales bacterium]|jgi:hypothetical protein|nr:hypothetical protein [Puniceicoccales bacterium]